jgi:DNA-binding response OmpR family regulator
MKKPKILVVDDEDMMFKLINATVSPLGYEFVQGDHLSDLCQVIEDQGAEMIILDYLMPEKNGMELAKELREKFSDLPILFLTSKHLSTEETKSLMNLGMNYMRKPFIPQALSSKLKEVLAQKITGP